MPAPNPEPPPEDPLCGTVLPPSPPDGVLLRELLLELPVLPLKLPLLLLLLLLLLRELLE
jgi:hypothetical protein